MVNRYILYHSVEKFVHSDHNFVFKNKLVVSNMTHICLLMIC